MELLDIKGLSISFGGIHALQRVDFKLFPEEILTVIGPNGSGKTTLFNCISGVYRPNDGKITFQGESLLGYSPDSQRVREKPEGESLPPFQQDPNTNRPFQNPKVFQIR